MLYDKLLLFIIESIVNELWFGGSFASNWDEQWLKIIVAFSHRIYIIIQPTYCLHWTLFTVMLALLLLNGSEKCNWTNTLGTCDDSKTKAKKTVLHKVWKRSLITKINKVMILGFTLDLIYLLKYRLLKLGIHDRVYLIV